MPASILNPASSTPAPTPSSAEPKPLGRACKVLLSHADVVKLLGAGGIRKQTDEVDACRYLRRAETFTGGMVNRNDLMPANTSAQEYLKDVLPVGQINYAPVGDAAGYTISSTLNFAVVVQRGDRLHCLGYMISLDDAKATPRVIRVLTAIAHRAISYA